MRTLANVKPSASAHPDLGRRALAVLLASAVLALPNSATAQWEIFEDQSVASVCGVINVVSLEFAVRSCDGALVLITGEDAGFGNTFVTLDGEVEIDGELAGFIEYQQDGDGFFTLWWVSEEGFAIDFDDVAYEPFETDFLPSDFANVPCEVTDFWDDDGDCGAELGDMAMLPLDLVGGTNLDTSITICGLFPFPILFLTLAGLMCLSRLRWVSRKVQCGTRHQLPRRGIRE